MTALVETGTAGRCVQMEPRERETRNAATTSGVQVVDLWTMHPYGGVMPNPDVPDGTVVTVSVTRVADDDDPDAPFMAVLTTSDPGLLATLEQHGLRPELGIHVEGIVIYPDAVKTADAARRLTRMLMRCAALGDIPMVPRGTHDPKLWLGAASILSDPVE